MSGRTPTSGRSRKCDALAWVGGFFRIGENDSMTGSPRSDPPRRPPSRHTGLGYSGLDWTRRSPSGDGHHCAGGTVGGSATSDPSTRCSVTSPHGPRFRDSSVRPSSTMPGGARTGKPVAEGCRAIAGRFVRGESSILRNRVVQLLCMTNMSAQGVSILLAPASAGTEVPRIRAWGRSGSRVSTPPIGDGAAT